MSTIRDRRSSLGLTQVNLAERLGVGVTTVQAWESGRRRPGPLALEALYRALDMTAEDVAAIYLPREVSP